MAIFTVGFNPAVDRILECPDFTIGGHQVAEQVERLAAGKAANVSRALALTGTDSIATGFLGTDDLDFFHTQLMALGPGRILCRFVEVGGVTRENISIVDPRRRMETHLRDRGFSVTPGEAGLLKERLQHDVRPADVVIFSGSLCGGINAVYMLDLIDQCIAAGARVVVDSSGDTLRAAAEKKLWIIKPNLEEMRQLLGHEMPNAATAVRDAARTLLPHVGHVLVSRGAAGAVLVTRDGAWSGRPTARESVVRTVGCGDHLLAGFVSKLLAGADLQAALRYALAVATARACSEDLGEFTPAAVTAAMGQVEVEPI